MAFDEDESRRMSSEKLCLMATQYQVHASGYAVHFVSTMQSTTPIVPQVTEAQCSPAIGEDG